MVRRCIYAGACRVSAIEILRFYRPQSIRRGTTLYGCYKYITLVYVPSRCYPRTSSQETRRCRSKHGSAPTEHHGIMSKSMRIIHRQSKKADFRSKQRATLSRIIRVTGGLLVVGTSAKGEEYARFPHTKIMMKTIAV